MAKKPVEVKTSLKDAVSASFQVTPNDKAPEGSEVLGGVMYKGTVEGSEKVMFQAVINGIAGHAKAGFPAALADALSRSNVVPANYDRPSKWTDIYTANKEPEPEKLEDLSAEDQKAFKAGYAALEKARAADTKSVEARRLANFKLAEVVRDVRMSFSNKRSWGLFQKFAPEANGLKEFLGGKNAVNEFVRAGSLLETEGFDVETMVGAKVSGAKGVISAYQTVVNGLAHNAVRIVRSTIASKLMKVPDGNDTFKLRFVLSAMAESGDYTVTEAGEQVEFDDGQKAMAALLLPVHLADWSEDAATIFDVDDGKYSVLKTEDGYVVKSKFGIEGADELALALARSLGTFIARKESASVADAEKATTAALSDAVKATKKPFAEWDADLAARHLANILFSRYPEDGSDDERAAAKADIDGIIEKIGVWADRIFEEEATVADILSGDEPESVEDAEDSADAAL